MVPAPPGSDLSRGLLIEEDMGKVTIGFDHGHPRLDWPPHPEGVRTPELVDPLAFLDAVLSEEIAASSRWANGRLRVASLHGVRTIPDLVGRGPGHLRARSWLGAHDRDRTLPDAVASDLA